MSSISGYKIIGKFFDGKTPVEHAATLTVVDNISVEIHGDFGKKLFPFSDITIAPRVGNIQRKIDLPDGTIFYTAMNDHIDEICRQLDTAHGNRFIHALESKMKFIGIAFIGVLLFIAGIYFVGIPYAAKKIAYALPASVSNSITDMTLKTFDKQYLGETTMSGEEQEEMRSLFQHVKTHFHTPDSYTLLIRDGKSIGANAFALPNGTVIITDQLVEGSEHNDEIAAIMAHEIGHAMEHHAMRSVIQGSSVMIILSLIMGDFISATNLAAMVPIVLIEGKYSRNFETRADDFSYRYLKENNLPLTRFSDILTRLDKSNMDSTVLNLISTHPPTKERIKRFVEK